MYLLRCDLDINLMIHYINMYQRRELGEEADDRSQRTPF